MSGKCEIVISLISRPFFIKFHWIIQSRVRQGWEEKNIEISSRCESILPTQPVRVSLQNLYLWWIYNNFSTHDPQVRYLSLKMEASTILFSPIKCSSLLGPQLFKVSLPPCSLLASLASVIFNFSAWVVFTIGTKVFGCLLYPNHFFFVCVHHIFNLFFGSF